MAPIPSAIADGCYELVNTVGPFFPRCIKLHDACFDASGSPDSLMLRDRIVPLIIAVALFMENMDSTVIATSLPAIAADIGTNPLALKLAVTSYLLSLAIFIPASGWTADRFGARTVFGADIAVFVLGSIGCALSGSLSGLWPRASCRAWAAR